MSDTNALDDPLVEEIMSSFKANSREVVKDTLEGIEMVRFAATLVGYIALLITVYTTLFIYIGYYRLNQPIGAFGGYGTFVGVGVVLFFYFRLRKKHATLKKKYASLYALYEKLGVA